MNPSSFDIAHVASVELFTPTLEDTLWYFVDVLGMSENGRKGGSVYLRGYDDYHHHTLKLTPHETTGVGRIGLRAASPEALENRAKIIEEAGFGKGWIDGDLGRGRSYLFEDPDGHEFTLFYETEWYQPSDDQKPSLKNQAQRFPGRGVNVRRLDHVNFLCKDVEANRDFMRDVLGFRPSEQIQLDDGSIAAIWFTTTNKSYDIVYTRDWTQTRGRFHHLAFALDSREDILRAADVYLDNGVFIETGPHKHAIQQTFFLYAYEPAGTRVELCNAGARLLLAPDAPLITWTEAERSKGQAWGLKTIESFHTHGTPPVEAPED